MHVDAGQVHVVGLQLAEFDDLLDLVAPEPVTVVRLQGDADDELTGPGVAVDGTGDATAVAGAALAAVGG